eukprot:GHVL01020941.1.p1 GENE.GHVL01020941.1~~GHVL01020941.1.p1  ORF type:complete len:114 (+),score=10.84 GHVL01020941.1:25-366(+)
MATHLAITTASALFAAGGYAYLKSGSMPSLIASSAIGSMFAGSAYLMNHSNSDFEFNGYVGAAISGSLTLAVAIMRISKTKKLLWPSVLLLIIGSINVPFYFFKIYQFKEARK